MGRLLDCFEFCMWTLTGKFDLTFEEFEPPQGEAESKPSKPEWRERYELGPSDLKDSKPAVIRVAKKKLRKKGG